VTKSPGALSFRAGDGQGFPLALEEHHQIRNATVVDIRVGMRQRPAPLVGVRRGVLQHVFVDLFLQIDAHGAVTPNNFIRGNAGVGRNVPAGIRDSNIGRNIADRVMGALHGGGNQAPRELPARSRCCGPGWDNTPQRTGGEHNP
jgi:hypothetical protein